MTSNNAIGNRRKSINSLIGIKVMAMLLLFWWHSSIPRPTVDIGARTCEILFVVSGFLVGYNYFYRNVPATWNESVRYAAGKIIKFWPLHFVTTIFVMLTNPPPVFAVGDCYIVFLNLSLLQAWSNNVDIFFSYNGVSWFLSALIFCYFMSPFLRKLARDVKVSGVLFVIVFFLRFCIDYVFDINPEIINFEIHVSPVIRCMEFFMGMLLVPLFIQINTWLEEKRTFLVFTFIEIMSCAVISSLAIIYKEWYRSVFVLLFCIFILIFSFDKGAVSMLLGFRPFKWFSSIQFEFYILHVALIMGLSGLYSDIMPDWRIMNAVMFLTILFTALIYNRFLAALFTNCMRKIVNFIFKALKTDLVI